MELLKKYFLNPSYYETEPIKMQNFGRLLRLSNLLGFSIYEVEDILVDLENEKNNLNEIFDIMRKTMTSLKGNGLLHVNYEQAHLIWKILYILLTSTVSDDSKRFDWVKNIDEMYVCCSVALSVCPEDRIAEYVTFSKLMRIISNIASQCETTDFQEDNSRSDGLLHQWIEEQYQDDSLVLPSNEVFPIIQKIIRLFVQKENLCGIKYFSCRLATKGIAYDEEGNGTSGFHIVQVSHLLHSLVNILQENNQHQLSLTALLLGSTTCGHHSATLQMGIPMVITSQKEQNAVELGESLLKTSQVILTRASTIITEKCTQLANTVLSHRVVDSDIALCYLQSLTSDQGKDIILALEEKFKHKFVRAQNILNIGVNYGVLRDDKQFQKYSKEHSECANWGRKLQLLRVENGCNMRYDLHSNPKEVEKILQALIKHPNIDLSSICSFCESFGYDEEMAILNYIEYQLTNIKGPSMEYYQENIDKAIPLLSNISKLQIILKSNIQKKVSPFDYERLSFIFKKLLDISEEEAMKRICEENLELLSMLSMYERSSEPSDWGIEENLFSSGQHDDDEIMFEQHDMPTLFKKRLPFHQLTKGGKHIIAAELTSEKNTFKLSPIMTKLNLNKDQLFAKAIQNIATKELLIVKSTNKLFDFSLVENIFNQLENCVLMMSVGRWLAKQLPKGFEKAKVVKRIVDRIAQILKTSDCDSDTEEDLKKSYLAFLSNYKYVSTESFLIEHGITDEKFFLLCKEPIRLIYELYHEFGDKVKFETGRLTGVPEIHTLAKKIAGMNEIDLQNELSKFVFKWLSFKRTLSGEEEELQGMASKTNKKEIMVENEKNLRRVIFALASEYNTSVIRNLIDFDQKHGNVASYTKMTCIRAFQVLFTLVDSQVIQRETKKEMSIIYEKIVTLIYLSELEKLHVSYTEETFKKCNKEGLVKGLWRNHSHESQGIRIIADICLDYKIFDPQLWNSLLIKIHHFDMIPYLTHVLVHLSGVPVLREIPSLVNMWKAVITSPFNSVSSPLTDEEEKNILHAVQLLTRCPVILDVGLDEIANLLKVNGLHTNAMYCMKLIPDRSQRENNVQALIEEIGIETLLAKVKQIRDQGVNDSQLDGVEEEIFNYVNANNLFVTLHGTVHFDRLVGYLVRSQKMNNLLVKTIAAGRLNNAVDLVTLYINEHPSSATSSMVCNGEMNMRQALFVYLQNEELLSEVKPFLSSLTKSLESSFNLSTNSEMSSPLMTSSFVN